MLDTQVTLVADKGSDAQVHQLLATSAKGNMLALKALLANGSDTLINERNYDRRTALHVASSEGRMEVVKYLVKNGALVNQRDRWGGTPLDDAERHKNTRVARFLIENEGQHGDMVVKKTLSPVRKKVARLARMSKRFGTIKDRANRVSFTRCRA